MVITQVKTGIAEMSSWLSTRPFKKKWKGGSRKEVFLEMVVPVHVFVCMIGMAKIVQCFLNWKSIRNMHFYEEKSCISSLIWRATNTSANLRTSEKFRLCVGPKGKIELPLNLSRQGVA